MAAWCLWLLKNNFPRELFMNLSVILPTFNEAGNINALILAIKDRMPETLAYEVIVVDDDSPDGTCDVVQGLFGEDASVRAIRRRTDRGLARSIRAGVEAARGDRVIVMDTDFTHDPAEIPRLIHLSQIFDVASCSRFCAGGAMEDRAHYLASLAFNWFIRVVLRTQIQDNLAGYFIMDRRKLLRLPLDKIFYGYGDYFFRLLNYCQRHRFSVIELPTHYAVRRKGESKSNFNRLLVSYTAAVLKHRFNLSCQ
jgi:dolichol-phosphate mannosyltransferase